jgi:hypothetical protein
MKYKCLRLQATAPTKSFLIFLRGYDNRVLAFWVAYKTPLVNVAPPLPRRRDVSRLQRAFCIQLVLWVGKRQNAPFRLGDLIIAHFVHLVKPFRKQARQARRHIDFGQFSGPHADSP